MTKLESYENYESRVIVIEAREIIILEYVDLVDYQHKYVTPISLGKHMPILLMPKVRKLHMYIVTFVTPGIKTSSNKIYTSWNSWHRVKNIFTVYYNTST